MSRTPEFELVAEASKAIHYGLHGVAHKIALVIKNDAWRRFVLPNRKTVEHESFAAFVTAKPPNGLGTDVDTIRRLCRDDATYLDLIDRALQRPAGRPNKETVDNVNDKPDGNRKDAGLRRLRKDRPDLHAQVLAGEMTAHAAMVAAGFRRKTITVPVDVNKAALVIARNFSPEDVRRLVSLLEEQAS